MSTRTFVLGLGNVLMGDDGFGPAAVHAFEQAFAVGPEVEIVDLGTPGLDLTPWLADARHVIIVDTVKASCAPGTMRIYDKTDLTRYAPFARTGPHDPGVKECVLTLEFAGRAPEAITVVGVVPASTGMGIELSADVAAAVPAAVDAIAAALVERGDAVSRRPVASASQAPVGWQPCPTDASPAASASI
jgi:hydrogenase maturation protease